jgi:putative transposase
LENGVLNTEIRAIFEENRGRYGAVRVYKVLNQRGILVNRKRVGRLMHAMQLFPKGTNYKYKRYNQKCVDSDLPNLLNQVFKADKKNEIWVGDITYIPTKTKTLYLAVFIDIFSRKVVGWSMDTRTKDDFVANAFIQAMGKEHPPVGLVVHTDHGAQCTGANFAAVMKKCGAIHSESRKGNPYGNLLMESFYRTIKRELVQDAQFKNPEQAKMEIFKYIETYYNSKRIHSSLGYLSPIQFEELNS